MASSEQQPLKKRRFYEPPPSPYHLEQDKEHPSLPPPQEVEQPPPETLADEVITAVVPPNTPPGISPEESRRRNKDEIRSVYDAFRRLKSCLSRSETSSPDLQQAFLSLVASSRGCLSVQRIASDFIPRYASYCLNSVEAAARAVVDMHNSCVEIIKGGGDTDGVAFETARSCVFGLADICRAAASNKAALKLPVIRRIRIAVFQITLSFFASVQEVNGMFRTFDQEMVEMGNSIDCFSELKHKVNEEDGSPLQKISKCTALSFLWILFSCPKYMLAACYELFRSASTDGIRVGEFFIRLVTSKFDLKNYDVAITDALGNNSQDQRVSLSEQHDREKLLSDGDKDRGNASFSPRNCLLHVILSNNLEMRSLIFSKCKKIHGIPAFADASETKSAFERSLKFFSKFVEVEDHCVDSDEDVSSASRSITRQYSMSGISNENPSELPSKDGVSQDSGGSRSMDFESSEPKDSTHGRPSLLRDLNRQTHSPMAGVRLDYRSNSFEGRSYNVDVGMGPPSITYASPRHPAFWLYDGDFAAMDVFSATRQIWLGFFGSDVSESQIRFQLESFGYIQQFFFFPLKGFALAEYRSLMDAVRCREYLRGHTHWKVKFIDIGMGTRGTIDGVVVGSSTCLYVGSISSQCERDDIIHGSTKVLYRGPCTVTDLCNEGALLMEFETPEEVTAVMAHLRQHHRERSNYFPPVNAGPMPHTEIRSTNPGNVIESPLPQTLVDSADSSRTRMSHLSSVVASLHTKCNVDNHLTGSSHTPVNRDNGGSPSNTLWIYHQDFSSPNITDEDLMAACDIALASAGSIVKLARGTTQRGCEWFVECSDTEAAATMLKNLRSCPGMFFHTEFSQPAKAQSENSCRELISPKVTSENPATNFQGAHPFGTVDPVQGGGHVAPGTADQAWICQKNDYEMHPPPGTGPSFPTGSQGPSVMQQQSFPPPSYVAPMYLPPNSSWDLQGSNQHYSMNPISPAGIPNSFQGSNTVPPFAPPPMNPLPPVQQPPLHQYDQMYLLPFVPDFILPVPPQSEFAPPLPPSPPPAPPPPNSPPPLPPAGSESSHLAASGISVQHQWQGNLCKSGVHYCVINAHRLDSDICKYTSDISEPAEWPGKLDMTKRTDLQHVRSTFTSTPQNRREVCLLVPSTPNDQRGFQDFITYLKQRECAGVIKIPVARAIWSRLLFILPYTVETCTMLGVSPQVSNCLIGLIVPKETNFEWA